jgi:site-specific DNA recombinase
MLRGLISCGICGRKMGGQHNHGRAHYRCRYPTEYALANEIDHPRTVYVREDVIVPALDSWLARIFDPEHLDATCAGLADASAAPGDVDEARLEAARRKLADCDDGLARYRAALEGGAEPTVVATWIAEVQGERLAAERTLAWARRTPMTPDDVRVLLGELGDVSAVLADADPALKAAVYGDLGLRLTYKPAEDLVTVEALPFACAKGRVGGGT